MTSACGGNQKFSWGCLDICQQRKKLIRGNSPDARTQLMALEDEGTETRDLEFSQEVKEILLAGKPRGGAILAGFAAIVRADKIGKAGIEIVVCPFHGVGHKGKELLPCSRKRHEMTRPKASLAPLPPKVQGQGRDNPVHISPWLEMLIQKVYTVPNYCEDLAGRLEILQVLRHRVHHHQATGLFPAPQTVNRQPTKVAGPYDPDRFHNGGYYGPEIFFCQDGLGKTSISNCRYQSWGGATVGLPCLNIN
jgi:hypothetical protein